MRVVGIDPGSRTTGIGIVEAEGGRLHALHYRALGLGDGPFPERLGHLFREVCAAVGDYGAEAAAVETVYVKRNIDSALKLGQARGAAIAALVDAGLEVGEYTPAVIKEAVVGRGSAGKDQVGFMIQRLLGLPEAAPEDAADALAVAVCHSHHLQAGARLRAAGAPGGKRS
ncbi:crossover junction endodeoxyribonuclease RuvC [Thiohalorhabdus sp.]|uniref:crossover junction endodeoxyribonuclease RuvC n=1 Tax=Thiohalorhabdus sp. TaxID=3094134 RepID=UPI002FC2F24A